MIISFIGLELCSSVAYLFGRGFAASGFRGEFLKISQFTVQNRFSCTRHETAQTMKERRKGTGTPVSCPLGVDPSSVLVCRDRKMDQELPIFTSYIFLGLSLSIGLLVYLLMRDSKRRRQEREAGEKRRAEALMREALSQAPEARSNAGSSSPREQDSSPPPPRQD
jgi:hypothetical protein